MAKENGFKSFFSNLFYEDDKEKAVPEEAETKATVVTEEEILDFEDSLSESTDVESEARGIIEECQKNLDPANSIAQVQEVLDLLGENAENSVIQKVLARILGCSDLTSIVQDGNSRKQEIVSAIEKVKLQAEALKAKKESEEKWCKEQEQEAESTYITQVNLLNQDCQQAIQEERKRSELAIEEIRKKTEEDIEELKRSRDTRLTNIAAVRKTNEDAVRQAVALVDATEEVGLAEVERIDYWLAPLEPLS